MVWERRGSSGSDPPRLDGWLERAGQGRGGEGRGGEGRAGEERGGEGSPGLKKTNEQD